jgi:hypothetical protein
VVDAGDHVLQQLRPSQDGDDEDWDQGGLPNERAPAVGRGSGAQCAQDMRML